MTGWMMGFLAGQLFNRAVTLKRNKRDQPEVEAAVDALLEELPPPDQDVPVNVE